MAQARNPSPQLREVAESAREKAGQLAERVSETAGDYYGQASDWMKDHSGLMIGVAGAVTVAGLIGFMIGRRMGD